MIIFRDCARAFLPVICLAVISLFTVVRADPPPDASDYPGYFVRKNIHYGSDPKHVFDLYIAEPSISRVLTSTTIVFAHGGGYYLSDKSAEEKYIAPLLEKGFDVVNTNYRLGKGIFAATKDLSDLLRHLVNEADLYGFASERFVLMGFSSGGQMSANIGFWQNEVDDPFNVPKNAAIAAIVNISGPSHSLRKVEQIFLNFDYQPFRELGAALFPDHPLYTKSQIISLVEPVNHFDKDDPPVFLWYGGEDAQIPPSTHERLLAELELNLSKNKIIFEPEGKHSPSEADFSKAFEALFLFLDGL